MVPIYLSAVGYKAKTDQAQSVDFSLSTLNQMDSKNALSTGVV